MPPVESRGKPAEGSPTRLALLPLALEYVGSSCNPPMCGY